MVFLSLCWHTVSTSCKIQSIHKPLDSNHKSSKVHLQTPTQLLIKADWFYPSIKRPLSVQVFTLLCTANRQGEKQNKKCSQKEMDLWTVRVFTPTSQFNVDWEIQDWFMPESTNKHGGLKGNLGCVDLTESNNHLCFMLSIWESLVLVINSSQVIMPLEVLVQYWSISIIIINMLTVYKQFIST